MAYPSQQITELRRQGELDQAYELGMRLLAERPGDRYVVGAVGWVLYDRMKRAAGDVSGDADSWCRDLAAVLGLPLSARYDRVLIENVLRQVSSAAWRFKRSDDALGAAKIIDVLAAHMRCPRRGGAVAASVAQSAPGAPGGHATSRAPTAPEVSGIAFPSNMMARRVFLPLYLAVKHMDVALVKLVGWFGFGLFIGEDYQGVTKGDRAYPCLAQEVSDRYLDALRRLLGQRGDGAPAQDDLRDDALAWIEGILLFQGKGWKGTPRRLGRVLAALGRDDEARTYLEPRATMPPRPFYVEWIRQEKGLVGMVEHTPDGLVRRTVRDAALASRLELAGVYTATLSDDGRHVLDEPRPLDDPKMRSLFTPRFSGRFRAVRAYGFVLPDGDAGGTAGASATGTADTSGHAGGKGRSARGARVFVPAAMVEELGLEDGAHVAGRAYLVRVRDVWAYRALSIDSMAAPGAS